MPSMETLLSDLVERVQVATILYCYNPLGLIGEIQRDAYNDQAEEIVELMRTTKRLFPYLELKGMYTNDLFRKLKAFYAV